MIGSARWVPAALAVLLLAASRLPAPPLDAGQRADRVAGRRAAANAAAVRSPAETVSRWQGQDAPDAPRVQPGTWSGASERSRWDGSRARMGEVREQPRVETPSPRPAERARQDGATWERGDQRASNRWVDPERRSRLTQDAPVVTVSREAKRQEELAEALSLADINRFQFRRGRPEEPGLPAEPAGGAGPVATPPAPQRP